MKSTIKLTLALVLIVFTSANLIITSDSVLESELKEGFVTDWERNKAYTLEYLNAMPAEAFSYKPSEDVRSFQEQYLHIAQGNIGLLGWATGAEKIYPDIANFETEASFQGKEAVIKLTTEVYDWCIEATKNMDMSKSNEMVGPNDNFKFSRMEWLKKSLEHQTHHRGQTTTYIRMQGIEPPASRLFK